MSTVAGFISAYLAHRRGKNPIIWFLVGCLFGLFGIFAFLFFTPKKRQTQSSPVVEAQPYLFGPSDKFWYYLDAANTQVGPMSYDGLSNGWKQGKIPVNSLVWHEELTDWTPLQDLIRIESKKLEKSL